MTSKVLNQRFRRIFVANFDAVHAYCLRRLPREEAADAVAEVFLVAWRRLDDIPTDDSVRLWLFGVARNVVRNTERSSRRRLRTVMRIGGLAPTQVADPENQVVVATEHREIMTAFFRLSRPDQEVLQLRLWEELSVSDTATVLQCSEKSASKRYQRALARLARATGVPSTSRTRPHVVPRGGEQ